MLLPRFRQALCSLGKNDVQRAQKLDISRRTFLKYKAGQIPKAFLNLPPDALLALAEDLRAHAQQNP